MFPQMRVMVCLLCCLVSLFARAENASVVCPKDASPMEKLAGKEIRRYVYLRTGVLLPIVDNTDSTDRDFIVVGTKDRQVVKGLLTDAEMKATVEGLVGEQYALKTVRFNGRSVLMIAGGDAQGALYGAYRFAEHLGVRFYLHGDVVPDKQIAWALPELHETRTPLFDRRGILPFHDFPEGPDWWSAEGYMAILAQLPKMGMNFFGLHTYPEHPSWWHVGPEPLVWIGPPGDIDDKGNVRASYPSRHFTASNVNGAWGYQPGKTGDYLFGAALLFDRDDFGADYMQGACPWNKMPPEECNELFNRMGAFLRDTFTYAKTFGVKTCIGTETPLLIPTQLKERLKAEGKNTEDPAVVQSLYEGMFARIEKTHPLDYFWIWTPENWTMEAVTQPQIDTALADMRLAMAAAEKVQPSFALATCGWVLGPPQTPALLDDFLPKEIPMSCINRQVGFTPVEPSFANVSDRQKWAIPWLEDDLGIAMPQFWVGRLRRDAADALRYGCTGLMGIHWRTRILAPNASALAMAEWDQSRWEGASHPATVFTRDSIIRKSTDGKSPFAPIDDFYLDWCQSEFGPEVAEPIAAIFSKVDGCTPRPSDWVTGPGSVTPDARSWNEVQPEYAFVDEWAALRPSVQGPGNLERFDYWLNTFCYLRSIAMLRCEWASFNNVMETIKSEKDPARQRQLANDLGLPARRKILDAFRDLQQFLLATVSTTGEMGTVCNWQQRTLPEVLTQPGRELAKLLGRDLPIDAMPSQEYRGQPRMFVPEIRTGIAAGEPFTLKAIVLASNPGAVTIHWRPLGTETFEEGPMVHVARGVYTVSLPVDVRKGDFEYYIQAIVGERSVLWPPTAPHMNQTVVVTE